METVEQRTMVEVSIRKFNKMQKQLEDERKKEKVNE
jgi:hypothetical protein